jgi:HEAT repeat protein
MNLAGAVRLARRLHRGEIDDSGGAYLDHLARVAAMVAAEGGNERQQMAAWLHGVGRTGVRPGELAGLGVPARVIQIVGALTPRQPWEPTGERARRVRSCPGAPLVLRADVADLVRPQALAAQQPGAWRYRAGQYRDLLDAVGLPVPESLRHAEPDHPAAGVVVLLSRLEADHPGRWEAVRELGAVGDVRAAGPLIEAYLAATAGDPRWVDGKSQLAGALSRIAAQRRHQDDPGWVRRLAGLAEHRDDFLRATAIRGLGGLAGYQDLIARALSDDSPMVVDAALGSLSGTEGLSGTLAQIAGRLEPDWRWPRRRAARLLVRAGDPQARAVLLTALAADGMGLGYDMIKLLAQDHDQSVIPTLVRQLRGGARGRAAAAYLLGEFRARDSVGDLAAVLADDTADLQVRLACIEALGKLADPAAVPALATAARHRLAWVRSQALLALSKTDHPEVAQVALAASEDFDPGVRDRAVRVLAARGGPDATARLLMFCDGPLAPIALQGLARIADERAVPSLIQVFLTAGDRRIRHLAGRALARSARRAPAMYPTTVMTPAQIRATAWVLGEVGDKASCRQLSRLLSHRDEYVRARAAAALGKIAVPETAGDLHAALTDISPHVRAAAATALGQLAVKEAAPWLQAARHDPHPAVRAAAQAAIRNLRRSKPASSG